MRGKTRDPIIALLAEMNSIAVSLGPRRITKDGASLKSSMCQPKVASASADVRKVLTISGLPTFLNFRVTVPSASSIGMSL